MNKSNVTRLALAIVLLSFLLSTFVSLWSLHLMGDRNRRELSLMMAARIYDTIVGELSEPVVVSQTMAHDSFLIELLENEDALGMDEAVDRMQAYLAGIKDGLGYEAAFVVSDASGRAGATTPSGASTRSFAPARTSATAGMRTSCWKTGPTIWTWTTTSSARTPGPSSSTAASRTPPGSCWACAAWACT